MRTQATQAALDAQFGAPTTSADLRDTRTGSAEGAKAALFNKCDSLFSKTDGPTAKKNRERDKVLRRALREIRKENYGAAALSALKGVELDPNFASARHLLAVALEKIGRLSQALVQYEKALELDPTDSDLFLNLGHIAWRLNMIEGAERLFRAALQISPGSIEAMNNLAGVLRDQGKYDDAIEILRSGIYTHPESYVLWNSIGTVMVETGDHVNAMTFYEEAARLNPSFGRAFHNMGYALVVTGPLDRAIECFDKALSVDMRKSERLESRYGRAEALIGSGQLAEGWREYEARRDPLYHNITYFDIAAPDWRGEDLAGKTILLVGEQGLGDEILFLGLVEDMLNRVGDGRIYVACEPRLTSLVARTYPETTVGPHATKRIDGVKRRFVPWTEKMDHLDYFAPLGSTLQYIRPQLEDFPAQPRRFRPDPDRVAHWREKLAELGGGPKIGVAWRSMLMSAKRAKFFSPFEHWAPIFAHKTAHFVNLQYGDVDAEIADAAERFGVDIWTPEGLDLKDDLDDNAALCAALDLAICPPNAAMNIAAAVGTPAWVVILPTTWTRLGTDHMPWYPQARCFTPDADRNWSAVMREVGDALGAYLQDRRAA